MNELNDDMKKMLAKQLPVQATSSQWRARYRPQALSAPL